MQLTKRSFTIVISEKGGAERRQPFDATEATIGRIQGNDVVLSKSNVSKQHAKIVCQDERFVVTDENSTNGTYVNRRRIQQPTIITEADRVFIGDFVLRLEIDGERHEVAPDQEPSCPVEPLEPVDGRVPAQPSVEPTVTRARPPLDQLGEDPVYPDVPPAPRLPGARHSSQPSLGDAQASKLLGQVSELSVTSSVNAAVATIAPEEANTLTVLSIVVDTVWELLTDELAIEPDLVRREQIIERTIERELRKILAQHSFPHLANPDELRQLARAELIELGPLGGLLEDPEVTEIVVARHDQILVRRAATLQPHRIGFSSVRSLLRIIGRLCERVGQPIAPRETLLERRLEHATIFWAVLPPLSEGEPSVVIRRRAKDAQISLDGLVRSGVISRALSSFLHQALSARLRILVTGAKEAEIGTLAAALCSDVSESPLVVLDGLTDLGRPNPACSLMRWSLLAASDPAQLVHAAVRTAAGQFAVPLESAALTSYVVEALGNVGVGVIAIREARTGELALARMAVELMVTRPGLVADAARRLLASSFDLLLEVVRFQDGRQRVVRVGEIGRVTADEIEIDDIFNFIAAPNGNQDMVEGTFRSTGGIPRVVRELIERGVSFDTNVFTRSQTR